MLSAVSFLETKGEEFKTLRHQEVEEEMGEVITKQAADTFLSRSEEGESPLNKADHTDS